MDKEYEESVLLGKGPCASCGSSDANANYSNGHSHCFSCGKHTVTESDSGDLEVNNYSRELNSSLEIVEIKALNKRKITEETARKFHYGYAKGKQVATYYDKDGQPVAQKLRDADKNFRWIGNPKKATLFGQQLWTPHPKKRIVLTEGEIDALSVSQIQQNKWAVCSVPNGADGAAKAVRKNLEYLNGFKEVVICFDQDDVGKEAAKEVAMLLPPNKAFIVTLPLKDANEMLQAGRDAELVQCLWDAKVYKPDGILNGSEIVARLKAKKADRSYPLPDFLKETQAKTMGFRLGELEIFTSGTGSGKTTLIKQLQHHIYTSTELNQALIHLEEPLETTANGLIGIALKTRLHMTNDLIQDEINAKAEELFEAKDDEGFYRFNLYDAFGSVKEDELYAKIRYMVKGLGAQVIWLDHLSILVSDLNQGTDERRAIDNIMHNLKSLTIELGCYIGLIVHLNNNTTGSKTFEEGAMPSLNNLRGSGGIKQLADTVYAFARNQQAEDPVECNTSQIAVLKCRYTGSTGLGDKTYFNPLTGCLEEPPAEPMTAPADLQDFE